MAEEELMDIKFRIYDGSDIGTFRYSATSTVDMLKQRIVSDWPKGKTIVPKSVNEVKLISSGKILENRTVGLCKLPFGEVPGGAIIMHVVKRRLMIHQERLYVHVQYYESWEIIYAGKRCLQVCSSQRPCVQVHYGVSDNDVHFSFFDS